MNNSTYIISSLKSRFLSSSLTVLMTAFGVAMALILLLFTHHLQTRMNNDGHNIDFVIGAKGSPLQIILSSVYHVDIPTGNIPWDTAQKWMKHPHIKQAIPLALGDNWKGYRIVGTTTDYLDLYEARIKNGRVWQQPFEAVIGADINMDIESQFAGAHGFAAQGHVHDDQIYTVVGKLRKTGTVLDRLILTSLDSVLKIHGLEGVEHHNHDEHEHDAHSHSEHDVNDQHMREPEITALLIQTKTPVATMRLPRLVNHDGALQAANPALEMARLTSMLGVGTKTWGLISAILMVISCFSIFAGIAGTLENRKTDLAVLRALGYSRWQLFFIIAGEGFILVSIGAILGSLFSMVGYALLTQTMPSLSSSGASYQFIPEMLIIYAGVFAAGILAAALPAYRAAKIDVAKQLS